MTMDLQMPDDGDALLKVLYRECEVTVDALQHLLARGRHDEGRWLAQQTLRDDLLRLLKALVRMGIREEAVVTTQRDLWRAADIPAKHGAALLAQAHEIIREAGDRLFLNLTRQGVLPPARAVYAGVNHVPGGRQAHMPGKFHYKRSGHRREGTATLRVNVVIGGGSGGASMALDGIYAHRLRSELLVRQKDLETLPSHVLRAWRPRPMGPDDCGYVPQALELVADLQRCLDGLGRDPTSLPVVFTKASIPALPADLGLRDGDHEMPGNDLGMITRVTERLADGTLVLAACGEDGAHEVPILPASWLLTLDGNHESINAATALGLIEKQDPRTVRPVRTLADGPTWSIDQIEGRISAGEVPAGRAEDATLLLFRAVAGATERSAGVGVIYPYICNRRVNTDEDVQHLLVALLPLHAPGRLSERFETCRSNSAIRPLERLACAGRNAHTTAHLERMRDIVNAGRLAGLLGAG